MRLSLVVGLAALTLSGCLLPTTIGLRDAGDLGAAGDLGLGLGGGAMPVDEGSVGWVMTDVSYTFREGFGVAGDLGVFGGLLQGQGELRLSTHKPGRFGLMGMAGLSVMSGPAVGPYGGLVGRAKVGDSLLYAGGKVNPVLASTDTVVWVNPTLGWSSRPGPFRYGVEGLYFFEATSTVDGMQLYGAQAWVRYTRARE